MKSNKLQIFIAGATGVLGRAVSGKLINSGHNVIGLSRSDANAETLKELGAETRSGNLFDIRSVFEITTGSDVIIHLATSIPKKKKPRKKDWQTNDRVRVEGTQNLIEAALYHKCKLYLQQSVTFLYANKRGEWLTEESSLESNPLPFLKTALQMESFVLDGIRENHLPGMILRLGELYSPNDFQTGMLLKMIQNNKFKNIGKGEQFRSIIHIDDAANAFVKAIDHFDENIGKVFNIVDDEPVRAIELIKYIAEILNVKQPGSIPAFLAKPMLGSDLVKFLLVSSRVKNTAAKSDLNWKPSFPTYREGYKSVIETWQ